MQSFVVSFHQEDNVDTMQVQKLTEDDFEKATEGGTRHLFELNTNIGLFVFFDGADKDGAISYMILHYEEGNEDPVGCYSFQLSDFYEFMALFLQDLEYSDETNEEEEDYGPIHHLAHLIFHIAEEGKDIEV